MQRGVHHYAKAQPLPGQARLAGLEDPMAESSEGLQGALAKATEALLAELGRAGHWVGELSSSALSTATAVVALSLVDRAVHADLIDPGLQWLATHANPDGGWGDTPESKSNVSTTALCWAAFAAARADARFASTVEAAHTWLQNASRPFAGTPVRPALVQAIERRYGKDRTFSTPILMTLALTGRLPPESWRQIPGLPFELAALPHQLFGALNLPVVSYALPALIAIGQVIHHHAPSRNPLLRALRSATRSITLGVLAQIQPPNGGFLEATPLTSFVTMSLAAIGQRAHPVTNRGVMFLRQSMRADGSWPIDTNLSTWVSTLAAKALSQQPEWVAPEPRQRLRAWLLAQQYRQVHPYTHAAPGGWAWTDLPGGVPDTDDTAGALLALLKLGALDPMTLEAGRDGIRWLLAIQNSDGGIPTFCKGWGALPFDRSSPDITAHTLRAWTAWLPQVLGPLRPQMMAAIHRAIYFLVQTQQADGSWVPLWFGNEHAPDDQNLTYGTSHVLLALRDLEAHGFKLPEGVLENAARWLRRAQLPSGAWSGFVDGPPSVEETALAVEAMAGYCTQSSWAGTRWLIEQVEAGTWRIPSPIGFYFAKLWYSERLYPLIFTVGALGKMAAPPLDSSLPPVP